MTTFAELIPDGCDDPHTAARIVIKEAARIKQLDLLIPAVAAAIDNIWRTDVNDKERRVFNRPGNRAFPGAAALLEEKAFLDADPDLAALLTCTFHVTRQGAVVTWGDATREQHEQRATFLEDMAVATIATADRHRKAAKILAESGVSTLNELFGRQP